MKACALLAGLLVSSVAGRAATAERKPLIIMAEDAAPPWSNPDGTGLANDTVRAAFQAMGVPVELQVVPYARCKSTVLAGKVAACFSMTWSPEMQGLVTLAREPLLRINSDVFESRRRPLPHDGRCRMPPKTTVGIVRQYEYPPETMALLDHGVTVERTTDDLHSLKMLATGRLDAAVVITNDLEPKNAKAVDAGVAKDVQLAFNCGHETGTIGFSTKHPDGPWAASIYEEGYRKIARNGELQRLRDHAAHH